MRADAIEHLTGLAHVFEFEAVCPPETHLLWLPAGSYTVIVTTDGAVTMTADVVLP